MISSLKIETPLYLSVFSPDPLFNENSNLSRNMRRNNKCFGRYICYSVIFLFILAFHWVLLMSLCIFCSIFFVFHRKKIREKYSDYLGKYAACVMYAVGEKKENQ